LKRSVRGALEEKNFKNARMEGMLSSKKSGYEAIDSQPRSERRRSAIGVISRFSITEVSDVFVSQAILDVP
ncbi:MAG TPA: hypothetical protein VG097_03460, partial [Gemmata sp.]|nr:hypothetical protein [Gemmata sp.]